jgi:hypothetical protein
MSDVGIAPAPAAAPAPSQGEVPINPNPLSPPAPIGNQAPPKPVSPDHKGSDLHPQSRREQTREAIRKAFERTSEPPKAVGSKMGHNAPPEPMTRERKEAPKPPPIDLKKRPDEQPGQGRRSERERGDHGHFAARADGTSGPGQQRPGVEQRQRQGAPNIVQLPDGAPYRNPPSRRMSPAAARDWGAVPETVRADVHRMHNEFANAYHRMHGDHQEMNRIRHFQQMAKQHGTSLDRALNNYVSMEQKLRSDPIGGLDVIINNLNLRTPDGQRLGFRDIAWHVLNQTPDQHQSLQLQNSQSAIAHQMGQLHQQQAAIAQSLQQLHYERKFNHTRGQVDRFAETHPRLDELGKAIERELRFGFDLDTAYRRADALYPSHAAQTRSTSAQTRTQSDRITDRSIHGAPDTSVNGARRRNKPVGRRDAIASAIKRVNGSL